MRGSHPRGIIEWFNRFFCKFPLSVGFSGTPQGHGTPYIPILFPNPTPIFESLKIWEWYGNSMGPAYHKGVPCPWESLESPLTLWPNKTHSLNFSSLTRAFSQYLITSLQKLETCLRPRFRSNQLKSLTHWYRIHFSNPRIQIYSKKGSSPTFLL